MKILRLTRIVPIDGNNSGNHVTIIITFQVKPVVLKLRGIQEYNSDWWSTITHAAVCTPEDRKDNVMANNVFHLKDFSAFQ